jgi:hypothetical protein
MPVEEYSINAGHEDEMDWMKGKHWMDRIGSKNWMDTTRG